MLDHVCLQPLKCTLPVISAKCQESTGCDFLRGGHGAAFGTILSSFEVQAIPSRAPTLSSAPFAREPRLSAIFLTPRNHAKRPQTSVSRPGGVPVAWLVLGVVLTPHPPIVAPPVAVPGGCGIPSAPLCCLGALLAMRVHPSPPSTISIPPAPAYP
jgi:hypothetical protein